MDWKTLILELAEVGVTQMEIGRVIGLSQPAVSDLARGRTLRIEWSAGQRLLDLHKSRIPQPRATAPITPEQEAA